MSMFINWFQGLDSTLRVYWGIAILTSIVFLIQMVLTLVGLGDTDSGADMGSGDMASDVSLGDGNGDTMDTGGAIQLFTIRNFVNFLLGIGWGGVCFWSTIHNKFLLAIVALMCGCAMVGAFVVMYRQLMKLESFGSYRIQDSIGQACDVYIPIPAARSGQGKVQISFFGSVQELPAMTDGEALASGTKVRVIQVIDNSILLVERI